MIFQIILYILLGILGLLLLITLIGLIGFFLIFRSCDKDRSGLTFNFRSSDKPVDVESMEFKEHIINRLYEIYEQNGFFPTYVKVFLSGDKRWDIRAMWENFVREPDIRWQILFYAIPQILLKKRRPISYSLKISQNDWFASKMHFPIFSALVVEQLIHFLMNNKLDNAELSKKAEALVDRTLGQLIDKGGMTEKSNKVLYKTIDSAGIANPIFNLVMNKSWSFPDCDTTGILLSVYQLYLTASEKGYFKDSGNVIAKVINVLHETRYVSELSGIFRDVYSYTLPIGRRRLRPGLKAFLTYFSQGMNDADSSINIDVLQALAINWETWQIESNDQVLKQINSTLEYLHFLAVNNLLFSEGLCQFYTYTALTYLWGRFASAFNKLGEIDRKKFDQSEFVPIIHQCILDYWIKTFSKNRVEVSWNIFEYLLLIEAFPILSDELKRLLENTVNQLTPNELGYEFFCVLYPLKTIYSSPSFVFTLLLNI